MTPTKRQNANDAWFGPVRCAMSGCTQTKECATIDHIEVRSECADQRNGELQHMWSGCCPIKWIVLISCGGCRAMVRVYLLWVRERFDMLCLSASHMMFCVLSAILTIHVCGFFISCTGEKKQCTNHWHGHTCIPSRPFASAATRFTRHARHRTDSRKHSPCR